MDDQLDFSSESDHMRQIPDLDTTTTPSHMASFHQSSWPQIYSSMDMNSSNNNNNNNNGGGGGGSNNNDYAHSISEPTTAMGITSALTSAMPLAIHAYSTNENPTHLQIRTSQPPSLSSADLTLQQALNVSATMLQTSPFAFSMPHTQAFNPTNQMAYTNALEMPLHNSPTREYSVSQAPMQTYMTSSMGQLAPLNSIPSPDPNLGNDQMFHMVQNQWGPGGLNIAPVLFNQMEHSQELLSPASLSTTHSEHSWTFIDQPSHRSSLDGFSDSSHSQVVSPQILHVRADSNSSEHAFSNESFSDAEMITTSPEPQSPVRHSHAHILPAPSTSVSPNPGSSSPTKPKSRKTSPNTTKTPKVIQKKKNSSIGSIKEDKNGKRVGRRRGPLKPEQRHAAHEIRKLRACLRCKFLKKVCDKGDPCTGCQPSHARLWQVPCTRIDIKEIGYFFKDWSADFERHLTLGRSVINIKRFDMEERTLYVTHGYGFCLPVSARRVHVYNTDCFDVDWVETKDKVPSSYLVGTSHLSVGQEGIPRATIMEYVDLHLDKGFDLFLQEYFDDTPFLTELLKSIYRYYQATGQENIRRGLKLVIAYSLTLHITLLNAVSDEDTLIGRITDPTSRWYMQICAPVMINFQVKKAMADLWRDLMKEVLEDLSALYASVYSGDKYKNWPTIFMLASLILSVWEMMQFDAHYRMPDETAAVKFCNEMEQVPVGVIVGLFCAISTKLPTFNDWDSEKHGNLWNNNNAICETMTSVRSHVEKHDTYLKTRCESKFEREDFDCLSNKFLSKLVLR